MRQHLKDLGCDVAQVSTKYSQAFFIHNVDVEAEQFLKESGYNELSSEEAEAKIHEFRMEKNMKGARVFAKEFTKSARQA